MQVYKITPDPTNVNILIYAYLKQSKSTNAFDLVRKMKPHFGLSPDVLVLNAVLNRLVVEGNLERAKQLLELMQSEKKIPNKENLSIFVESCLKLNKPDEAIAFFNQMKDNLTFHITPGASFYVQFMRYYALKRKMDDVVHWFNLMKDQRIKPTPDCVNIILKGYLMQHDFTKAQEWYDKLKKDFSIDEETERVLSKFLLRARPNKPQ